MLQLRHVTPKARKQHRCDWCYGPILPGEKYHRSTNIYDDRLYDWIACQSCESLCVTVWDWAYRPDEGIGEDSFAEWARDHLGDPTHGPEARAHLERRTAATTTGDLT